VLQKRVHRPPACSPHAGEFVCDGCGGHRGWLSRSTASCIENVIACFGPSTTPIGIRKTRTYEKEAPTSETNL
jgi:hypothetical protein